MESGSLLLDAPGVAAYLATVPDLAARLGGTAPDWDVREIGDGNVNFVFAVRGPGGALCVKQAPPFVRAAGESWPLGPERIRFEYRALQEHRRCAAPYVPAPLHYDASRHLQVTEYLDDHVVLRQALMAGRQPDELGLRLGDYLASSLFHYSDLALSAARKRPLVSEFECNVAMCAIMEEMIFTEIYYPFHRNQWTSPELDADVERVRADADLVVAVGRLKNLYLTTRESLLHGDLHTGSVMVAPGSMRVIDQEFACYGPMGFDIGSLLAHLLISYFSQDGQHAATRPDAPESNQQIWLLRTIEELWNQFDMRFIDLWRSLPQGDSYPAILFSSAAESDLLTQERREYLDRVFAESAGFCGAEMMRRIIGFARPADLTSIQNSRHRAVCERRALHMARSLLVDGVAFRRIEDVTTAARQARISPS